MKQSLIKIDKNKALRGMNLQIFGNCSNMQMNWIEDKHIYVTMSMYFINKSQDDD